MVEKKRNGKGSGERRGEAVEEKDEKEEDDEKRGGMEMRKDMWGKLT